MPRKPPPRVRGIQPYTKPALTEQELLDRWQSRGLQLGDRARAARYIRHIGYYRLSAYVRTFEEQRDQFRDGASFDDALGLYIFDRKLRLLVLDALERIEVAVRAAISDHMSLEGGPHWYEDNQYFDSRDSHSRLLRAIDRAVSTQLSHPAEQPSNYQTFTSALEHYVTKYGEPLRPPSWLAFEELSFGAMRAVYSTLADPAARNAIAETLGLRAPVLDSWLLTFQRVRNISAHHGRLWNRGLGVYPMIPKSSWIRWIDDRDLFVRDLWRTQRLYPVLVSFQSILYTISPGSQWSHRFAGILAEHSAVPLDPMGIPSDWDKDPFWRLAGKT